MLLSTVLLLVTVSSVTCGDVGGLEHVKFLKLSTISSLGSCPGAETETGD